MPRRSALAERVKRLACRAGLHLWCSPRGPFWISAYQRHVTTAPLDRRPEPD